MCDVEREEEGQTVAVLVIGVAAGQGVRTAAGIVVVAAFGVIVVLIGTQSKPANISTENTGLRIFNAGAGIQQGFIIIFTAILTLFVVCANKVQRRTGPLRPQSWKLPATALYLALAMITVRCVFRLCEYSNIANGPNRLLTISFA